MEKALVRGAWRWCCHEKQLRFDKNLKFEIGEKNVVERDNNIVFDKGGFEGMITIGVARAKKSIFPIRRGQDAVEKALERDAWCRCCHAIKAEKHLTGEKNKRMRASGEKSVEAGRLALVLPRNNEQKHFLTGGK